VRCHGSPEHTAVAGIFKRHANEVHKASRHWGSQDDPNVPSVERCLLTLKLRNGNLFLEPETTVRAARVGKPTTWIQNEVCDKTLILLAKDTSMFPCPLPDPLHLFDAEQAWQLAIGQGQRPRSLPCRRIPPPLPPPAYPQTARDEPAGDVCRLCPPREEHE